MHAVERARPEPTDSALIIGMGPIGLAIAQCLRDRVGSLVVTDRSPERLRFAAESLKVDTVEGGRGLASRLVEHGAVTSRRWCSTRPGALTRWNTRLP